MAKKKHHPDYDPEVEAGSVYLQKEVAVQLMLAIGYSLKHNKGMNKLDEQRLLVAGTVINNVFALIPPPKKKARSK